MSVFHLCGETKLAITLFNAARENEFEGNDCQLLLPAEPKSFSHGLSVEVEMSILVQKEMFTESHEGEQGKNKYREGPQQSA